MGLAATPKASARLDAAKIGRLAARANPRGGSALAQIAADWTTLFCLLDDHIERLDGPSAVKECLSSIAAMLRHGGEAGGDPLLRAGADLHARIAEVAPSEAQARFQERVSQLFEAFIVEAEVRRRGAVPDLTAYLPMRQVTVGLYVEFEISELSWGIDLGEGARFHPARGALARMASNIVGWANDIYTYEKELEQGEGTNLVAVLALARGLSLAEAVAAAARRHDDEVRSFAALCDDLPRIEGEARAELRRYASMLTAWVRGHLDWARETGRYCPAREPWPG